MRIFPDLTKSRVRRKLLAFFFTNPKEDRYLREIAAALREDPGHLSKELKKLERAGIVEGKVRGRNKYFSLNQQYPLYNELAAIVRKTIGWEGTLRQAIQDIPGVKAAFIYGSFAKETPTALSDIDLVIVGHVNEEELLLRIEKAEQALQREINYTLYTLQEWRAAKQKQDSFVTLLLSEPKRMLVGEVQDV